MWILSYGCRIVIFLATMITNIIFKDLNIYEYTIYRFIFRLCTIRKYIMSRVVSFNLLLYKTVYVFIYYTFDNLL